MKVDPKKSAILLIVLGALVYIFFFARIFVIRGSAGGVLFWNSNEVLLFMGHSLDGAHMSRARFALEPFVGVLVSPHERNDSVCSNYVVIRVTDKDVETLSTDLNQFAQEDHGCPFKFTIFGDRIYATSWPKLLPWTGTGFERPSPEEYGAYATALVGGKVDPDSWEVADNPKGWSMRRLGYAGPKFPLVINGKELTIVFHGSTWPPRPISLELIRTGQSPQTIWSFDEEPRRVSRAEYENTFAKRQSHSAPPR